MQGKMKRNVARWLAFSVAAIALPTIGMADAVVADATDQNDDVAAAQSYCNPSNPDHRCLVVNDAWLRNTSGYLLPVRSCPSASCREVARIGNASMGGGLQWLLGRTTNGAGNVWYYIGLHNSQQRGYVYSGAVGTVGVSNYHYDTVRVNANESPAPLRSCPRASCSLRFNMGSGATLTVLERDYNRAGNVWYRVRTYGGSTGWTYSGNVG